MTKQKTLREVLANIYNDFVHSRITKEETGKRLTSVISQLPLKEQAVAIDVIKTLTGWDNVIGEDFDITQTLPDFGGYPNQMDGSPNRRQTDVATAFNKDDF